MKQYIFKQLWNMRRTNLWIFLELVLIAFFLWIVIDPVYMILSNKMIPKGYQSEQVLRLTLGDYSSTHSRYKEAFDYDSIRKASFLHIYDLVRNYPGVEAAVVTISNSYPGSPSTIVQFLSRDTIAAVVYCMVFYQDGDFFGVFRISGVDREDYPDHTTVAGNGIYITRDLVKKLGFDGHVTGTRLNQDEEDPTKHYTVLGVIPNIKHRSTEQPVSIMFSPRNDFTVNSLPSSAQILFRIHDELSLASFTAQFWKELAPLLQVGNLYPLKLIDLDTLCERMEFKDGTTSTIYLQTGLIIFLLLCTFLGVIGNFWLRSDARKSEIGLRIAMGSTKGRVVTHLLTETFILTTIACLLGVLFSLQRVFMQGFAQSPRLTSLEYYHSNMFWSHFIIVSLIVYLLMLLTTLTGTLIPARQTAFASPVEALRDE